MISISSKIPEDVKIGQFCIIEEDVEIGSGTIIRNFVEIRKGTRIGKNCYIDSGVKTSGDCEIGDNVTLRYDTIIGKLCKIGDNTFVSARVMTNNLNSDKNPIGSVHIGKNCFIGTNTVFQHGIKIGDRSITGSMSFVNKDIPEGEIWIGNPAKFLRKNEIR
jgi:UDP-N-acetylglucosamine acyltransferase